MSNARPDSIDLACPACASMDFQVRALTDEGVGSLMCHACDRNYLLLDSKEYWFDVIQGGYPRLRKCPCGSTSFGVQCHYSYREDGDVQTVDVSTVCSACAKVKHLLAIDVDYSGTGELVERPLSFCENPKVLYDLQKLNLYVKREDIAEVVGFLATSCQCSFIAWIRESNKWVRRMLSPSEVIELVRQGASDRAERYLRVYASRYALEVVDVEVKTIRDEDAFWKRREIVRISSPTHVGAGGGIALLYYIDFANEYVDAQQVVRKSDEFVAMTTHLLRWLNSRFVTWRGRRCFDNPDEHTRIFGDRFTKRD